MGRELNRAIPSVKRYLDALAEELGYDLRSTMFKGGVDVLYHPRTCATPSLFIEVISALSLAVAHALNRSGIHPDAVAGRSAGEYTALMASNAIGVKDGFGVVRRIIELAQKDCLDFPSELMTAYGLTEKQARALCSEISRASGICELVTHFSSRRISIVGGTREALELFKLKGTAAGGRLFKRSPEAGAFHTSLVKRHARLARSVIESVRIEKPEIPFWCNYDGKRAKSTVDLRRNLSAQLDHPVRWQDIIEGMTSAGIDMFVEIAPGRMLTEFVFSLPSQTRVFATDTPANLKKTIAEIKKIRSSVG